MEFRRPFPNSGVSVPANGFDYIIWGENPDSNGVYQTVYAKNGVTGEVEISSGDAGDVLLHAIDNGKVIRILSGKYESSKDITLNTGNILVGDIGSTTIYGQVVLGESHNVLYGLSIVNKNYDKTGVGITVPDVSVASNYIFDMVDIAGFEKGIDVKASSFGDVYGTKLSIHNCKYGIMTNSAYTYFFNIDRIYIFNCDDFGQISIQNSSIKTFNANNCPGIDRNSLAFANSTIDNIFLESNTNANLPRGGFGSCDGGTVNNLYITNKSTALISPSTAKYLHIYVDDTSYLKTWGSVEVDLSHSDIVSVKSRIQATSGTPIIIGPSREGIATFTGDGSTTSFTIAHGLVATPSKYFVQPLNAASQGFSDVSADSTDITITFSSAPASGTTLKFYWYAEV